MLGSLLQTQQPAQRGLSGFLDRVVNPSNPLGMIGKAIAQADGGLWGNALSIMDRDRERSAEQAEQAQLRALQMQRMLQPEIRSAGNDVLSIDPATGAVNKLYSGQDAPTNLEREYTWLKGIDPAAADRYIQRRTDDTQWITADNGDGTKTIMPISKSGSLPGAPVKPNPPPSAAGGAVSAKIPQAARDFLRANPALARDFDLKYGTGAAAEILGGAPSQGGATFP